jgi:hypothetical protein
MSADDYEPEEVATGGEAKLRLEEYKLLAELQRYEGNLFWQRHRVYLAVNVALVSAFALGGGKDVGPLRDIMPPLLKAVTLAGALVSLAWFWTTVGGNRWCNAWDRVMQKSEDDRRLSLPTRIMNSVSPGLSGTTWPGFGHPGWWRNLLFSVKAWSFLPPVVFFVLWVVVFSWL